MEVGFIKRNGLNLFYRRMGNPHCPCVVFLHGITMSSAVWNCTQQYIASRGYFTLSFDFKGHGYSDGVFNQLAYSFDAFADDIQYMISQFGVVRPVIVGWSLGGLVAQVLVVKYPQLASKLILVDTGPQGNATPDFPWAISTESANKVIHLLQTNQCVAFANYLHSLNLNDNCNVDQLRQRLIVITLQANTFAILSSFLINGTRSLIPQLSQIKIPTLIVCGSQDLFYPIKAQMFMRLNIPNSLLVEFPGKGHSAFLTDSYRFNQVIYGFIQDIDQECHICVDIPIPINECYVKR